MHSISKATVSETAFKCIKESLNEENYNVAACWSDMKESSCRGTTAMAIKKYKLKIKKYKYYFKRVEQM